jgi:hypothetical protein
MSLMNRQLMLASLLSIIAVACVEFPTGTPYTGFPPTGILIYAGPDRWPVVIVGKTLQMTVEGVSEQGFGSVGRPVWESSDPSIATINSRGVMRGLRPGSVLVRATASGFTNAIRVHVRAALCANSLVIAPITLGETRAGELDLADCVLPLGGPAQGWRLTLAATTTIALETPGATFESEMVVTDVAMRTIATQDQSSWDPAYDNSREVRTLAAGTYLLWVSAPAFVESGQFSLELRARNACGVTLPLPALPLGGTIEGALDDRACVLPNGRAAAGWVLDLPAPTVIGLKVEGATFLGNPSVTSQGMLEREAQYYVSRTIDGYGQVHALPAGRHFVWVSPVGADTTSGAFALIARVMPICGPTTLAGTLAVGDSVTGSLTIMDCISTGVPRVMDQWALTVSDTGTVRIALTHDQFPWYLALRAPDGTETFGGGTGPVTSSRLEVAVVPGTYTISVFMQYGSGSYALSATPRPVP